MKRIILDHYRRWWWLVTAILAAYFLLTDGKFVNRAVYGAFDFQIILWLGFLLMMDLQRGLSRALATLPVTNKQIGRAWWLAAVALPAMGLGVAGSLAILIFSTGTDMVIDFKRYLIEWSLTALCLGGLFGSASMIAWTPNTFMDKARNAVLVIPIVAFLILQMKTLSPTVTTLIFSGCGILSVLGWFRAEQMVVQCAGYRVGSRTFRRQISTHKTPQGLGGLPYLVQKTFARIMLISGGMMIWVAVSTRFFFQNENRSQMTVSMVEGMLIPFVFVMVISLTPLFSQLRFLRAQPISSLHLAGILVLVPMCSIAVLGASFIVFANLTGSQGIVLPIINDFLILGAKVALIVSVIVWRGLDAVSFLFVFLLMTSGSFISLWLTMAFHLTKPLELPFWMSLGLFSLCVIGSICLTQVLLAKSSNPYRARTMLMTNWSMVRS